MDLTTNLGKIKKPAILHASKCDDDDLSSESDKANNSSKKVSLFLEKSENFTYNDKLCQKFVFLTQFLNKFQNRMEIKNLKIMLNKRIALFAKLIKYWN